MRQWHNDSPTDYGIEQFTEGDCWILAWAIWRRTGLPIVGLSEDDGGTWFHVLNRVAPGIYLDVNGIQTRRQLYVEWMDDAKMHIARQQWLEGDWVPDPDAWTHDHAVRRAYRMADRLIEKYKEAL